MYDCSSEHLLFLLAISNGVDKSKIPISKFKTDSRFGIWISDLGFALGAETAPLQRNGASTGYAQDRQGKLRIFDLTF